MLLDEQQATTSPSQQETRGAGQGCYFENSLCHTASMANISMVVLRRSTDTATTQQFLALKYSFNNGTDVSSQFFKGDKYSFLRFIFLLAVLPIPFSSLLILLFLVYKNCLEMALQVCKTLHKQFLDLSLVPHPLISTSYTHLPSVSPCGQNSFT